MFKFGCELLFSFLHIYKCRPYFGIYLHVHAIALFSSLLGWVGADEFGYLILNMHADSVSLEKNYSSHIKEKTVGLKKWSKK